MAAMAGFTTVVAAVSAMVVKTAKYAEEIQNAAQKTGIGVEELQGLKFAAGQTEVPFEALQGALAKFSKGLAGMSDTNKVDAFAKAIKAMGIETRDADHNIRPLGALMLESAQWFSKHKDSAEKSAIASALFGKAVGPQLIPFLNQGREGIKAVEEQARDLGLVLGREDVAAAAAFSDQLDAANLSLTGVEMAIGAKVIPNLTYLVGIFAQNKHAVAAFRAELELLAIGAKAQATGLFNVFGVYDKFQEEHAIDAQRIEDNRVRAMKAFDAEMKLLASMAGGGKPIDTKDRKPPKILHVEEIKDDVAALIAELDKADRQFGLSANAVKLYDLSLKGADQAEVALAGRILAGLDAKQRAHDEILKLDQATEEYRQELMKFALAVYDDLKTPAEIATEKVDKLSEVFRAGLLDVESYHKELSKLQDDLDFKRWEQEGEAIDDMAEALRGAQDRARAFAETFERGLEDLLFSGRSFREVLAGIFEDLGRMILRAAILGPMENFFAGLFGGFAKGGEIKGFAAGGMIQGFAAGGVSPVGRPILVGEEGPELFVPDVSGSIVPSGKSLGNQVIYNIDARGADVGVDRRILRALKAVHGSAIQNAQLAMQDRMLRSGA